MGSMKDSVGNVINVVFLVLGHPLMCLELGVVRFVSFPSSHAFFALCLSFLVVTS